MAILQTLMAYLSAHPAPLKTPATSLHLAQEAPHFLQSAPADTQETWFLTEQLFLASLRTRDDTTASQLLSRLRTRFGATTPRILALQGLYDEATATSTAELEAILERYTSHLATDLTDTALEKRRIALLQTLGRPTDAITALTKLLAHSPVDAEAWAHLADLYKSQGLYAQAIFCLEECLLTSPNAYNIHARLGEATYVSATDSDPEMWSEAARYFCRSVELCEWYLRGWYGLRLVTDRMLATALSVKAGVMDRKTAEGLNAKATEKLAEIVRRAGSGEEGWQGFDAGEVEAARELIAQKVVR